MKKLLAIVFLAASALGTTPAKATNCSPEQKAMPMEQICLKEKDGKLKVVDFCPEWTRCQFPDQAPILTRLMTSVDRKKDSSRDKSNWYSRWHFRVAITVAVLSFFVTIFVAISRMTYAFAHWFSIPAVIFAAGVTLASSIAALYAFENGIIRNERIRAEFGELQHDIQMHLLNAHIKKRSSINDEMITMWDERSKAISERWAGDYINSLGASGPN